MSASQSDSPNRLGEPRTYEEQMLYVLCGLEGRYLLKLLNMRYLPGQASLHASPQLRAACIISRHPARFSRYILSAACLVLERYDLSIRHDAKLPGFMEDYTGIKASGSPVDEATLANALGVFYLYRNMLAQAA